MAPTVLRLGPYRLFFYSGDYLEAAHIHVERDNNIAKFWLKPVRLQSSGGFRPHEIRKIQKLIEEYEDQILESWHEYFD
jgi:hypothetical protein